MQQLYLILLRFLREVSFLTTFAKPVAALAVILAILLIAKLSHFAARYILVHWINKVVTKTKTTWDDYFITEKVFNGIAHLVPLFIIYQSCYFATPLLDQPSADIAGEPSADYYFFLGPLLMKLTKLYFIFTITYILNAILNVVNAIFTKSDFASNRPITGYIQLLKILVYFLAMILTISVLINKDPTVLIAGLGAIAAVLMLVFKDTILGFTASIQLSGNDMVKIGDWIEIPSRRADGKVTDITLNTVKIQNWDKSITTVPTYSMVSESFINWKGMEESEGRRIKRSVNINVNSIRFCTPELMVKLEKYEILSDYIKTKEEEIRAYNSEKMLSAGDVVSGKQQTNIGIFRKYLELYLQNHPGINQEMGVIVRQLQVAEKGLPIEIYVFSKNKDWEDYERLQADIFDHIMAVIPEFELRIFQLPAGSDIRDAMLIPRHGM